ncbi:MAG: endonuclease III [Treponema sp.]|jgi:endonuclease-3|nr:endonuclease III [Treponema sp.]
MEHKPKAVKSRAVECVTEKYPAPDIPWAVIFSALEKWSKKLLDAETPPVTMASVDTKGPDHAPAVNVIAGETSRDPWAVLVSTVLSLRTKDEVTLITSQRLLGKAPTPAKMRSLSEEAVAALAYPAGFYRTKAASLKKIAEILLDRYDGKVPDDMENLLALPGVGRKTANLVLSEAFDKDAICVDIHVHRISNRLGFFGTDGTKDPFETEMALRSILPKKYWKKINSLFVFYGQQICRPVSPHCSRCVIGGHCPRLNVGRSR